MVLESMGWLALGLNVWGNLAIANKTTYGWLVRLACNAAWIIYSSAFGVWPLLVNHFIFAGINVYGWLKWRQSIYVCQWCNQRIDLNKYNGLICTCEMPIPARVKPHGN